ncbi:MAG: D-alanine--D-alanine ligase [Chitinispirillaceae bacterium]|nr:D-alanine--D-alanine ligase [Chitinispirillaceae bacterium]
MKKKINVIMGGPSAEHDVSLQTGIEVLKHIDQERWAIRAVVIGRKRDFFFCDVTPDTLPSPDELAEPNIVPRMQGPFSPEAAAAVWENCDAAFLALHGSFGEDGVIQGYLESIGIPYTGSGVFASAVAMNKITSKFLFIQNNITVPPYSIYGPHYPQNTVEQIARQHGFPCFVKCPQSGSSKLMGCASTMADLASLLAELSRFSPEILVEASIKGTEFSCGVLDDPDGKPFALPPIEIRPKTSFFDYTAKYTSGASEEIVPAPRPVELLRRIQQVALSVHRIIGCSGISRTDMILGNDTLYVLETNTLPGLTANSLLPKSFAAEGGTYSELIDLLINQALKRKIMDYQ